jgi:RiboL-PSP-HEPN
MTSREINRQLQALESLFKRVSAACGEDVEMRAHWARYLCILCAGFLENALAEVYSAFCIKAASEPVAKFARRNLQRIQNPKTPRFIETASYFKAQWRDDLKIFVRSDGREEAINAIMTHRHLIAHGKSSDITITRIKEYLAKAVDVIDFIERQCSG